MSDIEHYIPQSVVKRPERVKHLHGALLTQGTRLLLQACACVWHLRKPAPARKPSDSANTAVGLIFYKMLGILCWAVMHCILTFNVCC